MSHKPGHADDASMRKPKQARAELRGEGPGYSLSQAKRLDQLTERLMALEAKNAANEAKLEALERAAAQGAGGSAPVRPEPGDAGGAGPGG